MLLTKSFLNCLTSTTSQLADDQSLDSLAARSGWSKFHLHRKFHRVMGETPKSYTTRLRLERAAGRLAASGKSVLDIALESGFQSHEVFSRAFRRRYGSSPSEYRRIARSSFSATELRRHRQLVDTIGPCTALFRTPIREYKRPEKMPLQSITRKEIQAQPILFIQRRIPQTQLQPTMAECFGALFGHAMKTGLAIAGQPIARYVTTGPGLWTVDFIVPLAASAAGENDMQAGFLQEGSVAAAIHKGPYEELSDTNAAVEKWIEESGYSVAGPPWESYVTSPAEVPDPAEWITEIFWPISN